MTLNNVVMILDLQSLHKHPVTQHDTRIRQCVNKSAVEYLATFFRDRSLWCWDVDAHSNKSVASIPVAKRANSMDPIDYLMVLYLA